MGDKRSGTTRTVNPTAKARAASEEDFNKELATGKYDRSLSFFNSSNGGYLLYYKGRKMDNMEYNCATFMAMKGYQMKMTPEGRDGFQLAVINGKPKFGDGRVAISSYEQRSPKAANEATARQTVENAVNHARKKNAEFAVIFDYSRSFKQNDIKHGIEHYERSHPHTQFYSVKDVIVVSGSGNIHEWEVGKRK